MKRWIAFLMTMILLFALCACGTDRPGTADPGQKLANKATSEPIAQDTETADAWRTAYQQKLQQLLDEGTPIASAWVRDVDGDGIPLVALSFTEFIVHPMPEIILNYKNGRLIIKNDIDYSGTGGSINNQALFANGTDYLIVREQGMTGGTFLGNDTTVFTVSPQGDAYITVERFSVDTTQIEAEADSRFEKDASADVSDFIERIAEAMDQRIAKYAPDGKFYNYADEMTWFSDPDEADAAKQVQSAAAYLEQALGITLHVDESVNAELF